MNLIVFAIPIFLTTTLLEAWLAHRRGLAAYSIPDAISSYQYGLLSQVVGAFTKCNRSINPVLADGFFQEAEAEAGEQFHGSSAS
ncbi:hypothetical protein [Pseudomonas aeruginosa]|uniref:hypothetical protein n=1 Tax=Pseudomonas aeruginosa TaxID=287 RepID=UPI0009A47FFB|nr:hypothetical protein [Pseudomonas aeruginosa]